MFRQRAFPHLEADGAQQEVRTTDDRTGSLPQGRPGQCFLAAESQKEAIMFLRRTWAASPTLAFPFFGHSFIHSFIQQSSYTLATHQPLQASAEHNRWAMHS